MHTCPRYATQEATNNARTAGAHAVNPPGCPVMSRNLSTLQSKRDKSNHNTAAYIFGNPDPWYKTVGGGKRIWDSVWVCVGMFCVPRA